MPHVGSFLIGLAFYVAIAIAFAGLCSAFVGIPEVKTILGGFEIRNFLEPWTLVVKLAGLPLSVATGLCIGHDGPMLNSLAVDFDDIHCML
ncbi:unnamed protein product [Dibothriocephalus latus]|uniref:Uncharacterized protein n=1 Tax=Dibothriocephalus latus TaxID=60516 RepID=A0A3P7MK51_DIBLA|nr:unnamed protein product [Dibothriocephalus latus]